MYLGAGFPDSLVVLPGTRREDQLMAKDLTEYRIVCSGSNELYHGRHVFAKASLAKAEQSVIDSDHHASLHPDHFYAVCAPWRIEARTVSKWKRLED